eukprot:TRINITY_DN1640_c0_g1_i1.p1 TRINITY_DN1640_c0_g1~~TRINITY_DN1640_c0_g1_i1.p1  ORF type:complete len:502 (-),score=152.21 TRINITY_DN1640_c0_g1_i1:79-1584(-)
MEAQRTTQAMKAIIYNRYGTPDNLEYVTNFPIRQPTGSEVLVKVIAASINPVDWKMLEGYVALIQFNIFPFIPGFDVAGVIISVGSGCKKFKAGDEIFAYTSLSCGAFAEYITLSESSLVHKPKNLTFKEAATIPLVGLTGYQALLSAGYCQFRDCSQKKVLVLGGAGGTGSFGIQLAKHYKCFVCTTASERNTELVKSLGADQIINYREENWWEVLADQNYDLVYDTVGGEDTWKNSWKVLNKQGSFITIVGDDQHAITVGSALETGGKWITRKYGELVGNHPKYAQVVCSSKRYQLEYIKDIIEQGAIKAIVDKEFLLENLKEAFEYSISGKASGKIVVVIGEEGENELAHEEKGKEKITENETETEQGFVDVIETEEESIVDVSKNIVETIEVGVEEKKVDVQEEKNEEIEKEKKADVQEEKSEEIEEKKADVQEEKSEEIEEKKGDVQEEKKTDVQEEKTEEIEKKADVQEEKNEEEQKVAIVEEPKNLEEEIFGGI